ncbi:MAG TPA: LptF/LptG family permease [Gemmatimonadales bacterium]|nr:LptF/LptG family permease [Gemmatimonadales bacterium]
MARPIVRILSRYILRQHLPPLGYALAALTFAMLVNQIAKQFGNFVGKGLPWGIIIEVFALSIPFIVAMTLPMAVLVAVLYTFSHLAADNEVTAMKAGGVSIGRIMVPVLGGATVMTLIAFAWNDQILPRSNHELRTLLVDIQRKKPTFQLKEQVINEVVPGQFFLRAARIDAAANTLTDVQIYDLQDPDRRRIITAESGRMAYTPNGTDLYLTLRNGEIHEIKRAVPEQFNRTFYTFNRIKVAGVTNTFEQTQNDEYRSDREMGVCEMQDVVARARRDEERAHIEAVNAVTGELRRLSKLAPVTTPAPDTGAPAPSTYCKALGLVARLVAPHSAEAARTASSDDQTPRPAANIGYDAQLVTTPSAYAQRLRAARQRGAIYEVEIQKKLAISVACLVFALLGVPLAIRFPRGGVGLVIGSSLAVFSVYYVGLIGGEELGNRLIVSPFVSMWMPNVIFTIVAFPLLWSSRHAGSTAHGGDWQEVRTTLFGWIPRLIGAGSR